MMLATLALSPTARVAAECAAHGAAECAGAEPGRAPELPRISVSGKFFIDESRRVRIFHGVCVCPAHAHAANPSLGLRRRTVESHRPTPLHAAPFTQPHTSGFNDVDEAKDSGPFDGSNYLPLLLMNETRVAQLTEEWCAHEALHRHAPSAAPQSRRPAHLL